MLTVQVLENAPTRNPEDAQATFDLLGSTEKELFWIEGTTRRFKDAYDHFGRYPEKVLRVLGRDMSQPWIRTESDQPERLIPCGEMIVSRSGPAGACLSQG